MDTAIWIYFIIGCFALFIALLSFLFAEIGDIFHDVTNPIESWLGDHLSFGHDHDVGFSRVLNNGGILGFIAGFGFIAALAMNQFHIKAFPAGGWGILGGLVIGIFMGLFWFLLKQSGGTAGYSLTQLIGQTGVVTEKIYQKGLGRVSCMINGMPTWHTATTTDQSEILPGTTVKIIKVVGSTLYVLPESQAKNPER